jgi:hypothetical protein
MEHYGEETIPKTLNRSNLQSYHNTLPSLIWMESWQSNYHEICGKILFKKECDKGVVFHRPFLVYFLKRKVGLMRSPVCLSVCVSPLITFEPIGRSLWNSVERSCHWRWPRRRTFNHSKIADVQTSEVDAKLAPVNMGPWNLVYW